MIHRLTLVAALVGGLAAPAFAQDDPSTPVLRQAASLPLLVCEQDDANRSAYLRQYGAPPEFVTAEDILAARSAGDRWETPRCMTARQERRLRAMSQVNASL